MGLAFIASHQKNSSDHNLQQWAPASQQRTHPATSAPSHICLWATSASEPHLHPALCLQQCACHPAVRLPPSCASLQPRLCTAAITNSVLGATFCPATFRPLVCLIKLPLISLKTLNHVGGYVSSYWRKFQHGKFTTTQWNFKQFRLSIAWMQRITWIGYNYFGWFLKKKGKSVIFWAPDLNWETHNLMSMMRKIQW